MSFLSLQVSLSNLLCGVYDRQRKYAMPMFTVLSQGVALYEFGHSRRLFINHVMPTVLNHFSRDMGAPMFSQSLSHPRQKLSKGFVATRQHDGHVNWTLLLLIKLLVGGKGAKELHAGTQVLRSRVRLDIVRHVGVGDGAAVGCEAIENAFAEIHQLPPGK
jgi:hypothetical protein